MKKYKEVSHLLNAEINEQKAKVSQLQESARQVEEPTKENSNLKIELTTLREHVDKVRAEAVVKFQTSQAYYDKMGI